MAVRHLPAHLNCISMGDMVQTGSRVGGVCWSIWQKAGGGLDVDGFGEEVVVVVGAGGESQENDRSGVGGG